MNVRFFLLLLVAALSGGIVASPAADPVSTNKLSREEIEKRREEWGKLTPEERNARMKEMRERAMEKRREDFNKLTPEEREAKRKELRERLEKRLNELRAKQTNGTITPEETRDLERREQIKKRFEQNARERQAAPAPANGQCKN